jgi:prephenate dehydrogenase
MELLVVGAGAMGRWFGAVVAEAADDPVTLQFADSDPAAAREAADALGGEVAEARSAEVVCVAVPMPDAPAVITEYAPGAAAVVDVTGSMEGPVAAMREHAPAAERLSLHPLFAPENAPGSVPFVADAEGPLTDTIREALAAAGNDLVATTPEEHDEAMETVQARTHAAVLAFGLAAEPVPEGFETPISAALREQVDQVTDGDPRVYADIQAAFDGAEDIAAAAERIADADPEAFEQLYREAGDE